MEAREAIGHGSKKAGKSWGREVTAQRETKCTMLSRLLDHEIVIGFHIILITY